MSDSQQEPRQPGAGQLIGGRYRLQSRLGGGAMGSVWSGLDELLRRPIAVKAVRLPPGMPEGEAAELRERTLREARAIAVVSHPNVVTLYDVARDGGEPFVVMELVPSRSLAALSRERGALDEQQLAAITDAVASALESAHRAGIVHRDVKPGNVLLAEDGRIKLSDFGISRNLAEPTLTRTGIMLGTPAFIAPEVASGEQVTAAADLWGLGATLFAASEGHPPYDADGNPLATVNSVVRGPVPTPSRTGPIGEVISGLMVKDPHGRMPLAEARSRVHHLLGEPDEQLFASKAAPEAPTVRARQPSDAVAQQPPQPAEENSPAPLAADPGPLPFAPREPAAAPRRRSRLAVPVLAVTAVLVFLLAAGGGFAATRMWAGQPVLPTPPTPTTDPGPEPLTFVPHVGRADHPGDGGEGGARYTLPVPRGWSKYQGYREGSPTRSTTIHFVSPDGRVELVVQRFGGYYERGYTTQGYVNALPEITTGPTGRFHMMSDTTVDTSGDRGRPDRVLRYRTTTGGIVPPPEGDVLRRTTHARLMPRNGDLWIVRVTSPAGGAPRAEELYKKAVTGFTPLP